ncbi:MAG: ATP-binding protein, partial [Myxococcota bacterium]
MASPYRDARQDAAPRTTDDGIVDDLVRQFADPYAFFRELVQNGIDAGASELRIQLIFEKDGSFQASVRDDGSGMTPEILEGELLVLFKSGKENREDAIGKFGVGFISVFALGPERVTVRTTRGHGPLWTLHLFPDHAYEIFEGAGGSRPGTTVSVEVGPGREPDDVAAKAEASLRRWCRHARIPLHFRVAGPGRPEHTVRIDTPLGLDDQLAVVKLKAGKTDALLGLPREPEGRYAGFFNAGLMLHETREGAGLLGGLAYKVQDPRLEHTLSRDDVRRDRAHAKALGVVQRGIPRLRAALLAQLEQAAAGDDAAAFATLTRRVLDEATRLRIDVEDVPMALLEPLEGRRIARLADVAKRVVLGRSRTPLTAALAEAGWAVLDGQRNEARMLNAVVRRLGNLAAAEERFTLALPVPARPSDDALLGQLEARLDDAWRRPVRPRFAELLGREDGAVAVGMREGALAEGTLPDPFALLGRAGL